MNRLFHVQPVQRKDQRKRSARQLRLARLINVAVILLVVILVWLVCGGLFRFTVRQDSFPSLAMAEAPSLSFLNVSSADAGDVLVVRSPVLFALPTRVGFSAPLQGLSVQSPVPDPIVQPATFIRPLADAAVNPFGQTQRRLADLMAGARPLSTPAPDYGPVVLNLQAPVPAYRFFWQDQPSEPVPGMELASASRSTNGVPWQAEFLLCFTPDGSVQSLMIEKPGPDVEVNLVLARFAREIVQFPRAREFCRRLVIQFQPAPKPPVASPNG